jgi:ribosomal protein S18 acetylase RimI-like enzyme
MQIDHDALPPAPRWPAGVALRPALVASDAPAVHALLVEAFAGSQERVPAFESWLEWWTRDASFDPSVWFLAEADGGLAGAALCWDDGFVKDLAVRPRWRRRGLGEALLRHAFREFYAREIATVSLKVDADNPTGALRLYQRVGMRVVERTARGPA